MTNVFAPEQVAALGELERRTDAQIAAILTGLDEGLGFAEIAARGDTNVEKELVRDVGNRG